MKMLIVDDSKAMRMLVRRALRQAQIGEHTVEEAASGEEALTKLRGDRYDLVLADWNMPGMNGLDVLKAAKAEGLTPHFGFITSESSETTLKTALEHGAEFLITKPFTPEAVRDALKTIGGGK
jgi:two-component system chemotaxis response regulator CheY